MQQKPPAAQGCARDIVELAHQVLTSGVEGRVVLCHGCFDPLHHGHLQHFREARKFGDVLVVTITADRYVNKGVGRPIFNAEQRADMVAALRVVDFVAVSEFDTASRILEVLRPAVFVKGIDYVGSSSPLLQAEMEVAGRLGIEVRFTGSAKMSATDICQQTGWL